MPYLSPIYGQMDGTKFASANCGPAVCTELIDLSTVGAVRIPAPKIRTASGDMTGGIEGGLLAQTVNKLTGYLYPFVYRSESERSDLNRLLERVSIGLIINCAVTVKTKYRTNAFTGLHWVTVAGGTLKDGTDKVEDPGTTYAGWQRWPRSLLFEAAEAVLGQGKFWLIETPATENTDKEALRRVRVFAKPNLDAKVVKRLEKGRTVHVIRTRKGGPWKAADGRTAYGWNEIPAGFVVGRGLR